MYRPHNQISKAPAMRKGRQIYYYWETLSRLPIIEGGTLQQKLTRSRK